MYCVQCGCFISEGRFCPQCGYKQPPVQKNTNAQPKQVVKPAQQYEQAVNEKPTEQKPKVKAPKLAFRVWFIPVSVVFWVVCTLLLNGLYKFCTDWLFNGQIWHDNPDDQMMSSIIDVLYSEFNIWLFILIPIVFFLFATIGLKKELKRASLTTVFINYIVLYKVADTLSLYPTRFFMQYFDSYGIEVPFFTNLVNMWATAEYISWEIAEVIKFIAGAISIVFILTVGIVIAVVVLKKLEKYHNSLLES